MSIGFGFFIAEHSEFEKAGAVEAYHPRERSRGSILKFTQDTG